MQKIPVALCCCEDYGRDRLKGKVAELLTASGFQITAGMRLLLKPNLVMARRYHDLACTHPALVAAVAEYCLDCGAVVQVGDSPATGNARQAMLTLGMTEALAALPVEVVEFAATVRRRLPCGLTVAVARAALECDHLFNLPKVKAHGQVRLTMAVKNYFGLIKGWRKAMIHQRYGGRGGRTFMDILIELPALFPSGVSLIDGVLAMEGTGPMDGRECPLALLGCSQDPYALDTALLAVLGVDNQQVPLWQAAVSQQFPGTELSALTYPLASPDQLRPQDFLVPDQLAPLCFTFSHVVDSLRGRLAVLLGKGKNLNM